MRKGILFLLSLSAAAFISSCASSSADYSPEKIIALERAALDRWGKGDPQGYLELMAEEMTYFDPTQESRVDGLQAMKDFIIPLTGKIKVDRYEMIKPHVQRDGNMAVLTYNLISTVTPPDRPGPLNVRWNSTEVYRRIDGNWKIVHSHWSYIKPGLKESS